MSLSCEDTAADLPGLRPAIQRLRAWIESRHFAGYEPFDLLNSPYLRGGWARRPAPGILLIQMGKRFGGLRLRRWLRIPPSCNPKALGLCLSAYCDLARCGYDVAEQAGDLKRALKRFRSPQEPDFCWGYDWDYLSLRGSRLPAFTANCIATYFCGMALLDMFEVFGDLEARAMGVAAARFVARRLNRSFESADAVCFSYTAHDRTIIYNSSALAGVLLARAGMLSGEAEYIGLGRKAMVFLERAQLPGGGWHYGQLRRQRWIDSFHTSYNVCALLDYQRCTGDLSFEPAMLRGHRYYTSTFFTDDDAPRYFAQQTFPVDIHACSQALLHLSAFSAPGLVRKTFEWTMSHMAAADGSFYYQRHRWWTNRTPYMRWGQAWMLRALAALLRAQPFGYDSPGKQNADLD